MTVRKEQMGVVKPDIPGQIFGPNRDGYGTVVVEKYGITGKRHIRIGRWVWGANGKVSTGAPEESASDK